MDIHWSCLLDTISIDMQWIPRDLNSGADDISKFIDYDDCMINDTVCNALDELWGPHTCNRFAFSYNAKIHCFNSRFYQPGSSGINVFSRDWSHHNNWLCPLCISRVKLLSIWSSAVLKELWSFPFGSQPTFGPSCVQMLSIGVHLPYLLVYKLTFYDQKIIPKNRPRLIHKSYTKTWPSNPRN